MIWNEIKAKQWLVRCSLELIKDELYAEGGALLYHAKWGRAANSLTEIEFRSLMSDVLSWLPEFIDDAVEEILKT